MQTIITPIENGEAWQVQVNFVDPDAAQLIEIAGQVANIATEAKDEAVGAATVSVENANAAIAAKEAAETLAGQAAGAATTATGKAAEAAASALAAINASKVAKYPFRDDMLPIVATPSGLNLATIFDEKPIILFKAGTSKFTNDGVLRKVYLRGYGNNGLGSYRIRIKREHNSGGGFSEDILDVPISGVSNTKRVVFEQDFGNVYYRFVLDFSLLVGVNVFTDTLSDRTIFHTSVIFQEGEALPINEGVLKDGRAQAKTGQVYEYRTNQYPFDESCLPDTNSGGALFNIASMFKHASIVYKNGFTKLTDDGKLIRPWLRGFGRNGSGNYFLSVRRINTTGGTSTNDLIRKPADVADIQNVEFFLDLGYLEMRFICDFTVAQTYNINSDALSSRTIFHKSVVQDQNDLKSGRPDIRANGLRSSYLKFKKYRNSVDGTKNLYDGSYSWWCRPIAITYGASSYLSFVDREGDQVLYDVERDDALILSTEKQYSTDEHNSASFLKMSNNEWVVAYTGHNDDGGLRIRFGDLWNKSASISQEHIIRYTSQITYTQIVEYSGRIFLVFRSQNKEWAFTFSDDFGRTWRSPKNFMVQGATSYAQMYLMIQQTGTKWVKIYQYWGIDDAEDDNRVSYGAIDLSTFNVYDREGGSLIGNILSNPIITDNLKVLKTTPEGYGFRLLDVAGNSTNRAVLTYSIHNLSNFSSGDYYLLDYNLSNDEEVETNIVGHGGSFTHTYPGGAYIRQGINGSTDSNPVIYLSRLDGTVWKIEKYTVTSGVPELNGVIDQQIESGSLSSNIKMVRPMPPIGALSGVGVEIFYIQAKYLNSYIDWTGVIKTKKF